MPRRAVGRRLEMRVAEPAVAALGNDDALTDFGEVREQRLVVFVEDLRAGRAPAGSTSSPPAPERFWPHAMTAGLGLEVLLIAIVDQRVQAVDAFGNHVAATAAIAAVGSAEFDELLAAK